MGFLNSNGLRRLWAHIVLNLDKKANIDHKHDDLYYTKTNVDAQDAATLQEAQSYTDTEIALLLNNSSEAVDSIMELAAAMEENEDVVDALEQAIGGKADAEHTHDDKYYTKNEIDGKLDSATAQDAVVLHEAQTYTDAAVANVANANHDHDDKYYTEAEIDDKLASKSEVDHNHDNQYYTKPEIDDKLDTKADVSSIPTALSGLTDDATHRTVTDAEKAAWNAKFDFSGMLSVDMGGTGHTTLEDTVYTIARYRASALVPTETNPSINGVINWMYE